MPTFFEATIAAIDSVISDEEKELLKITRRTDLIITFTDQLRAFFWGRKPIYMPEVTKVRAAAIMETQRLNIEKLKLQNELINIFKNPESYYKESEQLTEGEKNTGVISSSTSASTSSSFSQNKSRSGSAEHYEEYDIIGDWDKADQKTLEALRSQPKINTEAKEWFFVDNPGGKPKKTLESQAVNPLTQPTEIPLSETMQETIPLDTLDLNTTRGLGIALADAASSAGRVINSEKTNMQKTKTFIRAEAAQKLQNYQFIDVRTQVIKSFDCLFRDKVSSLYICQ